MGKVKKFLPICYFLVGYICIEILYSALIAVGIHLFGGNDLSQWFSPVILLGRILIVLGYLSLFRKFSKQQKQRLWPTQGLQKNTHRFFIGLFFGVISIILVILIRSAAGLVTQFYWLNLGENFGKIVLYFSTTMIIVFVEEVVFRGTFFSLNERLTNSFLTAVLITSVCFSLLHISSGRSVGILDLIFFFLFSVFLCSLVQLTGTVWTGVGFHFGWNFLSSGSGIFSIRYSQIFWQHILWAKIISLGVVTLLLIGVFSYTRTLKSKFIQMEGSIGEK